MKKQGECCEKPLRSKLQGPNIILSILVLIALPMALSLAMSIDYVKFPASISCIMICIIFMLWHGSAVHYGEQSLQSKEMRRNDIMSSIYGMLSLVCVISLLAKMALG